MKLLFQLVMLCVALTTTRAQTLTNGQTWRYQLTEGAALMDDCPICGRPTFWEPLTGSFDLAGTPAAGSYIITNINFRSINDARRSVFGAGSLKIQSGEAILTLDVDIFNFDAGERIHMTNSVPDERRIFPMVSAQAVESPASPSRVYHLRVLAAPLRELWFSTASSFTNAQNQVIPHGDLLSNVGRVVKRNAELTERLAIPEGEVGLDALDVGPRGEIFFSTTTNVESVVNGMITHSDLVTAAGRVYLQSAQLLSAFGVDDPDAGLDALHIISEDEVYFSITKDIPRAGATTLHRGDVLSNKGRIIRTETNLFLRWISPLTISPGLDALYVWPNGEIWFSTESDFTGPGAIPVSAGDIISDQGYIAFKNANLLAEFAPTQPVVDSGLDAMFIIADPAASKAPTQILEITATDSGVDLRWDGAARIFQIERATDVAGPYVPWTNLQIERTAHDTPNRPNLFYRVRQW